MTGSCQLLSISTKDRNTRSLIYTVTEATWTPRRGTRTVKQMGGLNPKFPLLRIFMNKVTIYRVGGSHPDLAYSQGPQRASEL